MEERRGWLMVLATLTASISYSAALNPPGGMWSEDDATLGFIAGQPVLLDKSRSRYMGFYYCNAICFTSSVCIITLLAINRTIIQMFKGTTILDVLVTLDMMGMVGAFVAGSSCISQFLIFNTVIVGFLLLLFTAVILLLKLIKKIDEQPFCEGE